MGGERCGYIVRFYEGDKFLSTPQDGKQFQNFRDDPDRNYAVFEGECPTDRPLYVDVRET